MMLYTHLHRCSQCFCIGVPLWSTHDELAHALRLALEARRVQGRAPFMAGAPHEVRASAQVHMAAVTSGYGSLEVRKDTWGSSAARTWSAALES